MFKFINTCYSTWGFPKLVGFPNKPMGFPTKTDQHLGCEMGVFPPFKETSIYGVQNHFFFLKNQLIWHKTEVVTLMQWNSCWNEASWCGETCEFVLVTFGGLQNNPKKKAFLYSKQGSFRGFR